MSRHPFVPLRHREVRLLWTGAVISDIGTWVQLIVVASIVAGDTGSAVKTGLVALATFMPQGISSPLGGLLADRYERKRIFATCLIVQAIMTSGLALVLASGVRTPSVLTVIILCGSAAGALGAPSYAAMLPDLVPADEMMAMVSLGVYSWNSGRIVGPLLGSLLVVTVGPAWTIAFNAVTFALLAAAVTALRRSFHSQGEAGTVGERLTTGWRALRHTPGCLHGVVILVIFNLTVVPFMGLIPIYAKTDFATSTGGSSGASGAAADGMSATTMAGLMSSAQGIGAILGGFAVTLLARRYLRATLSEGIIVYLSLALAAFALAPTLPWAVAGAALLGAGGSAAFITLNAIVQRDAPEASRGRVMALMQASMGVSYGLGLLFIGGIADLTNLRVAFGVGAAGILLGFFALTLRSRHWRQAVNGDDVLPEPRPLVAA